MEDHRIVEYRSLGNSSGQLLKQVEKTYTDSFPEAERRDFPLFIKLIEDDPRFTAYALFHERQYIGFLTTWDFPAFSYIEHFAIDASFRNCGFGRIALRQWIGRASKPLMLEVELPEDEAARRRIAFYERLGFVMDHHPYRQPPYRKGESGLPMALMSYGDIRMEHAREEVKVTLYNNVYGIEYPPAH
ncbi:MAG: GNAT family N-acetyltransferase [Tannerellaceae bacterium]|jgi:ribosomal protein S18 acetylase RimI-like enzyme|nr:GNAT family N-acetyltransferase [Tannerellaceae bacterium]